MTGTYKVTIICRYCDFGLKDIFASTRFCGSYLEMVQGRQILMFYTTIVYVYMIMLADTKFLCFWANPH